MSQHREVASNAGRVLGELPLKGTAMDAEEFGGLGHVSTAVRQHALDMFPFDAGQARNDLRRSRAGLRGCAYGFVSRQDLVRNISSSSTIGSAGFSSLVIGNNRQFQKRLGSFSRLRFKYQAPAQPFGEYARSRCESAPDPFEHFPQFGQDRRFPEGLCAARAASVTTEASRSCRAIRS
jgi:hypothetical protein